MTGPRFTFHARWRVPAPAGDILAVLADVEGYPRWWPQVRSAVGGDDAGLRGHPVGPSDARPVDVAGRPGARAAAEGPRVGECVFSSALPFTLRVRLREEILDRDAGVLRAVLDGDLAGWAQWRVCDGVVRLDQDCEVTRPWMRATTGVLRPAFVANHAWMMRGGERGLREWLAVGAR